MPFDNETETTGTTERETGDAVEKTPTTESPTAADRDAKSGEVEQLKALLAAQKDKIEEANRILKDREQAERTDATPSPAASTSKPSTREVLYALASGPNPDPAAVALLEMERNLILREQLRDIPKDKHEAVKKHFEANSYRLGDYNAALAEIEAPSHTEEIKRLREENERLKNGSTVAEEVRGAPPTHDRGSGTTPTTKTYTREQWNQELASRDIWGQRLLQRELNTGKLRIQG